MYAMYAVVFTIFAVYLGTVAVLFEGFAWFLLWPAVSVFLVGLAYAGLGVRVFGKRPDGRLVAWKLLLMLPFLCLTWGIWHFIRFWSREAPFAEVISGFWIGRRCFPSEIPSDITIIVDLTSEFFEPRRNRTEKQYHCLPILDAGVPQLKPFEELVAQVASSGPGVFIHCGAGHGRTGLFAAAVLIARGAAFDRNQAIAMMRAVRPRIRLNQVQRRFLRTWNESRIEIRDRILSPSEQESNTPHPQPNNPL